MDQPPEKKQLYEKIADFVIIEIITSGLALILVVYGLQYMHLKYAWTEIVKFVAEETGLAGSGLFTEVSVIIKGIHDTPIFQFLLTGGGYNLIIAGAVITIFGLVLKLTITSSREEFYEGVARNIYEPGVIGIISMFAFQVITTISLLQLAEKAGYNSVLSAIDKTGAFSSGVQLFGAYSDVLLMGIYCIIMGSVFSAILKTRKVKNPLAGIIGSTVLNSGYAFVAYYALLRVLVFAKAVSLPGFGYSLGIFAITSTMSKATFMLSISMIILGFRIKGYARDRKKEKKHLHKAHHENLLHQEWDKLEERWHHPKQKPATPSAPHA